MKSMQERQRDERERKLAEIEKQVAAGTLVIRKMTPEERLENPPREAPPRPKGRRRR